MDAMDASSLVQRVPKQHQQESAGPTAWFLCLDLESKVSDVMGEVHGGETTEGVS
jgi:hypothetical protein